MQRAHTNNNQKGIAHVAIIIVVVVLAVAGFAGWKVYQKPSAKKPVSTSSTQQASLSSIPLPTLKTSSKVPVGFVLVKADKIGVSFAYPKEWGKATLKPGPEQGNVSKGNDYLITFSENSSVQAGLRSKDWTLKPDIGYDRASYVIDFATSEYLANIQPDGNIKATTVKVYSYNGTADIIGTWYGGLGCNGVGEVLIHKLKSTSSYPSIAFLYTEKTQGYPSKESGVTAEAEDLCGEGVYAKYISAETAAILQKIDGTISEL